MNLAIMRRNYSIRDDIMKLIANREHLLPSLNVIAGVVERRQTLPILSNLLFHVIDGQLTITATDLEIEVQAKTLAVCDEEDAEFTLPAKKFIDICKALPEGSDISIDISGEKAIVRAARSRFTLSILPSADFPSIETADDEFHLSCTEGELKSLIDRTSFAMAQQDVRYYLNGLLVEIKPEGLRAVATDGHRLALYEKKMTIDSNVDKQVLIPRKAVVELGRLLKYCDGDVRISVSPNSVRFNVGQVAFKSKLIDGRFPDYDRVIPKDVTKSTILDKDAFRQSLTRAAILSNDKYKGVRLLFSTNTLQIQAHNPEQEQAEEELLVEYQDEPLTIGFNVAYLLDVLGAIDSDAIVIHLKDSKHSAIIKRADSDDALYVVMPMHL